MSASALGAALFSQQTAIMQTNTSSHPSQTRIPTPTEAAGSAPSTSTSAAHMTVSSSCYGYHNTFHTHALPVDPTVEPPRYDSIAFKTETRRVSFETLPDYSCSVLFEGPLGFKSEYINVYERTSQRDRQWQDVYVILRGTQLNVHRIKTPLFPGKSKKQSAGRLLRTYSLQHAEVGVALDFRKTDLIPRSPLAKLVPPNARKAVYQTDPHLFFPVREFAFRLRCETEQFLLCSIDQEGMLDWVERLCAAVDISPPLDDRSEPRYRSLPRRGRRQRQLDGRNRNEPIDLTAQRLLAEQERIIRTMYPHLARDTPEEEHPVHSNAADADAEDLDVADMLFPGRPASPPEDTHNLSATNTNINANTTSEPQITLAPSETVIPSDPPMDGSTKLPRGGHSEPSASSILRYRRRCAPVLLSSSPRASEVIFYDGQRLRINLRKQCLQQFKDLPPHYAAHHFTAAERDLAMRRGLTSSTATSARPTLNHHDTTATTGSGVAVSFHTDGDGDLEAETAALTPIVSNEPHLHLHLHQTESTSMSISAQRSREESTERAHDSEPPSPTMAVVAAAKQAEGKVEENNERERRGFLSRAKAPLTSAAEAFGGLVI